MCISKGKVHKRDNFDVKVAITVTNNSNFVWVFGTSQITRMTDIPWAPASNRNKQRLPVGVKPEEAFMHLGYRDVEIEGVPVCMARQKRSINIRRLKRSLKRIDAIEPII